MHHNYIQNVIFYIMKQKILLKNYLRLFNSLKIKHKFVNKFNFNL